MTILLPEGNPQQIRINVAMLCALCFPKPIPAIIVYQGNGICADCMKAIKEKEQEDNAGKE